MAFRKGRWLAGTRQRPRRLDLRDRALRTFVSRLTASHRAETAGTRGDLEQLRALVIDAATRMSATVDALHALHAASQGASEAASGFDARVSTALDASVVELQFADLASQLIAHVDARVKRLESLEDALAALPDALRRPQVNRLALDFEPSRASPVAHLHLQCGTTERF